jgi:hypothetical protein
MQKVFINVVLCSLALGASAQNRIDLGNQVQGVLPARNGGNPALVATSFPGSDIGAQINAAYKACAANTGCAIIVPPPAGGGFYTMTTPVVFGTSGKNISLDCMVSSGPENGAIRFAGEGVAVTVDTGSGVNPAHGVSSINNCQFFGLNASGEEPKNTQVGLRLGLSPTVSTTNGAIGFHLTNSNFFGFGIGVEWGANTWGTLFTNSWFYSNAVELRFQSPYDSGENISMAGGGIGGGTVELAGIADFHFSQVSFDATQIHSSVQRSDFLQCHFEDYLPSSLPFIVAVNGEVSVTDSTMLQDANKGTLGGPLIAASGISNIVIRGLFEDSNIKLPNLFTLSGSATLEETSPVGLWANSYNTATPVGNTGTGAWMFEQSPGVFLGTGAMFPRILGPVTAPSGTCTAKGAWVFSQDGHATFCDGSTWTKKI